MKGRDKGRERKEEDRKVRGVWVDGGTRKCVCPSREILFVSI